MSELNDLFSRLSGRNVKDAEVDKIVETATSRVASSADNKEIQEQLSYLKEKANEKKGNKDIRYEDTDKDLAKDNLDKKMKMLGIVGVVHDEKTGMVVGIQENGQPKLINQDDAFLIAKNLNTINPNRNNYALGDEGKNQDDAAQLDQSKIKEVEEKCEDKQKRDEAKQEKEENKEFSKEKPRESNAMEDAMNKVFGGNQDRLKKDILSGRTSPELKEICTQITARTAKNAAKGVQQATQQVYKSLGGRI